MCVYLSETERKQNLKDAGSSKPPAVLFWEADTFLTRLPSKRQSRTCRLRTRTPLPGRGIILQLHKVTIRDTLVGLGWIWNTAEGGLSLQGTWSHLVFMDWGYSPKYQPNAEVAAGFLHKPLALPQGCFRDRQKVPAEEIFAPEMMQINNHQPKGKKANKVCVPLSSNTHSISLRVPHQVFESQLGWSKLGLQIVTCSKLFTYNKSKCKKLLVFQIIFIVPKRTTPKIHDQLYIWLNKTMELSAMSTV